MVREFDVATGRFVEGEFRASRTKSNVAWFDENALFSRLTRPRIADRVGLSAPRQAVGARNRFAQARLIAEGQQTDISLNGFSVFDGETRYRSCAAA